MDANQTSAMFNDIGTKIFWGEALATEDYTNILGFLESRRQQIAAEFEHIVPRFSEPFKDFTRKSEPFLSATGMRILDRGQKSAPRSYCTGLALGKKPSNYYADRSCL